MEYRFPGLDHIVLGAANLDIAIVRFFELTGVQAVRGGSHPGIGTRNALVGLNSKTYLEILAPDEAQSVPGTLGEQLLRLERTQLIKYAISGRKLAETSIRPQYSVLEPQEPVVTRRLAPDSTQLEWELLFFGKAPWTNTYPFVIDWQGSPHPSLRLEHDCSLEDFVVKDPRPAHVRKMHEAFGASVAVEPANGSELVAKIMCPKGIVTLS